MKELDPSVIDYLSETLAKVQCLLVHLHTSKTPRKAKEVFDALLGVTYDSIPHVVETAPLEKEKSWAMTAYRALQPMAQRFTSAAASDIVLKGYQLWYQQPKVTTPYLLNTVDACIDLRTGEQVRKSPEPKVYFTLNIQLQYKVPDAHRLLMRMFYATVFAGCLEGAMLLLAMEACVIMGCLLYTSPSPRDATLSRMPSSA